MVLHINFKIKYKYIKQIKDKSALSNEDHYFTDKAWSLILVKSNQYMLLRYISRTVNIRLCVLEKKKIRLKFLD